MNTPGVILIALTLLMCMLYLHGIRSATRYSPLPTVPSGSDNRLLVGASVMLFAWIVIITFVGVNGLIADFSTMPPKFAFFLVGMFAFAAWLALSPAGRAVSDITPLHILVGFQSFRIIVEIAIHEAYLKGLAPQQMTWSGRNLDIITGLLALILIPVLRANPSKKLAWMFNIIGIGLLVNVLTVAVLSMPTPMRVFMNEPSNVWVTAFPYIFLPAGAVVAALVGHLMLTRKLLTSRSAPPTSS